MACELHFKKAISLKILFKEIVLSISYIIEGSGSTVLHREQLLQHCLIGQ